MEYSCPKHGPSVRTDVPPPPPTKKEVSVVAEALRPAPPALLVDPDTAQWVASSLDRGIESLDRSELERLVAHLAEARGYVPPPPKYLIAKVYDEDGEELTEEEAEEKAENEETIQWKLECPKCGEDDEIGYGSYIWSYYSGQIDEGADKTIHLGDWETDSGYELREGFCCFSCGAEELLLPDGWDSEHY